MDRSYFFEFLDTDVKSNPIVQIMVEDLERFSDQEKKQVYVISSPVGERKYKYSYREAIIILIPNIKLLVVNVGTNNDLFEDFFEDFIEDLGVISDKYDYRSFLGRPRKWKDELIEKVKFEANGNIISFIHDNQLRGLDARKGELLISLLTGSINDIDRVDGEIPQNS